MTARAADLVEAMGKVNWMQSVSRGDALCNLGARDSELMIRHLSWLQKLLQMVPCCPVSVGSGRAGVAHKMHAWLRALRLTSRTWLDTILSVNVSVSSTTDGGTEARLSSHAECSIKQYLPWASGETEAPALDFEMEPDAETSAEEEQQPYQFEGQERGWPSSRPRPPLPEQREFRFRTDDLDSVSDDDPSAVVEPQLAQPAQPSPSRPPDDNKAQEDPQPEAPVQHGSVHAALQFSGVGGKLGSDVVADAHALKLNPYVTLRAPGMLHILRHACEYMTEAMAGFKDFRRQVAVVCDVCRRAFFT